MPALVTLMMPCFNAADTLPLALSSLLAQTYQDWECVCVDDGSSDHTKELLRFASGLDARFKVESFGVNRGRGAARQRCLELGRGSLLAFLDADDWMYPRKLELQVARMADARLVALSSGAAITDERGHMVGVTRGELGEHAAFEVRRFTRPKPPGLVFPTAMVRMSLAKATGFDERLRRSQDSDFLIRLLLGREYALSNEIVYAYSQASAASLDKTLEGYRFRVRSHLKHVRRYPFDVARTVGKTVAKYGVYRVAGALGLEERLIHRRWSAAPSAELAAFESAFARVSAIKESSFGAYACIAS